MKDVAPRRERRAAARANKTVFQAITGARTPFKAALAYFEELNKISRLPAIERPIALREFLVKFGALPRTRGHGTARPVFQRTVFGSRMKDRSVYCPKAETKKGRG